MVLFLDEARAVAALPRLLPNNRRQREEALRVLRRVLGAHGDLPEKCAQRLHEIEAIFAGPTDEHKASASREEAAQ